MNITQFKKGDLITRVEPMCYFDQTNGGSFIDHKFIGKCITFLGLANGMIYGTYLDENNQIVMINTPQHRWENGWEFWIDPMTLLNEVKGDIKNQLSIQLFEAEEKQDYQECIRLRDEIKRLKESEEPAATNSNQIIRNNNIKMIGDK